MITHLDHVYSYLRDNDLESGLSRMSTAGFRTDGERMRHPVGHYNGFAHLTGTYLEFVSIVDEDEFKREASNEDRIFRAHPQPFGIGAVCTDPDLIYERISQSHPGMKPPESRGQKNDPDGPLIWTFCPLPHEATPGADVFPLKYLSASSNPRKLCMGENSIFGLTGFVFCSQNWATKKATWEGTLRPITYDFQTSDNEIRFGFQRLTWVDPERYEAEFRNPWIERQSECGDIAAVRLAAQSLEKAQSFLERSGFVFLPNSTNQMLRTRRDESTGYTFEIEQGDPEEFTNRLNAIRARN